MEDKEKNEEIIEEETSTPEEELEVQEEVETPEEPEEPKAEDIDYKGQLEQLQTDQKPKSEEEKARKALYYNAERAKELGLDPAEVLGLKKTEEVVTPTEEPEDADVKVRSIIQQENEKRDLKAMCDSIEEFQLAEWYMDNKGLGAEEAYLLANKGRIQRSVIEAKRGNVTPPAPSTGGEKPNSFRVPERSDEEKNVLARRGMHYNPKTKTYQGKFYEEYYDHGTKSWQSRKLQK